MRKRPGKSVRKTGREGEGEAGCLSICVESSIEAPMEAL